VSSAAISATSRSTRSARVVMSSRLPIGVATTNKVPGMWMTGNAVRLMERTRPGALHTDLVACNAYADGLGAAQGVRCPALLILGQRDLMAPAKNAQALIAALREPRVVTLAGAGHAMMAEQPDAVLDALRAFV